MHEFLSNPHVQDAIKGFTVAAVIDLGVFLRYTSWDELATFNWRVATFRWVKGIAIGLLGSYGFPLAGLTPSGS